jgi:predicted metal-dependent enzyme (double-stranded beta helix superfamily)
VVPLAGQNIAIDNDRVTVWDLHLKQGEVSPKTSHDMDTVVMFLEGGTITTTTSDGRRATSKRAFGDAILFPKGSDATQQLNSRGEVHEVIVALKDAPAVTYENKTALPAAFPRPGSVKVLDSPRVVVWHYSWTPGNPTPMHFHDKDVVVAYRYDGSLKSVTPEGKETVNAYKTGNIRFNKGDRAHYEVLTIGQQSAMMAELK